MKKHILFTVLIFSFISSYCFATPQPTGLTLEPSSNSIEVTWNSAAITDLETEGYYIFYWVTDEEDDYIARIDIPGKSRQTHTISGLESSTNYSVYLTAYDADRIESTATTTITANTDNLNVTVKITGGDEITVSITTESSTITTYEVSVVEFGESENFAHTGHAPDSPYVISGMVEGVIYEILVQTKDSSGDVIDYIDDIPNMTFESATTFFNEAGEIENGCFVSSSETAFSYHMMIVITALIFFSVCCLSHKTLKIIFMVFIILTYSYSGFSEENSEYKNTVGIKGGFFEPSESMQSDVYDNIVPVSLFYERSLSKHFSADIEAGYSKSDGSALSSSGQTGVETELELIPISMSLNAGIQINPLIAYYFGVGGDWWSYTEKSSIGEFEGDVGGWHAKTGFKLYTADSLVFRKTGVLIEISYAQIDGFGSNDVNLGGWTYSLGLIHSF